MVYKYAYIFLALILILSTSNCSKGTAMFTITGNISDATLGGGLENGTISIYKVPVGSSEKILIESKNLEADGAYTFSFAREAMEKYVIEVIKEVYDKRKSIKGLKIIKEPKFLRHFSAKLTTIE